MACNRSHYARRHPPFLKKPALSGRQKESAPLGDIGRTVKISKTPLVRKEPGNSGGRTLMNFGPSATKRGTKRLGCLNYRETRRCRARATKKEFTALGFGFISNEKESGQWA